MNERRVVITGMGTVCALGGHLERVWAGVLESRSGIRAITHFDASKFSSKVCGYCDEYKMED
jgi:3-oxoacyl-[acyl-carrier-protein] synthase II